MIKKIYSIILLLVFTVSMVGCETNSPFVSKRVSSKSEMQEETQSENAIESTVQSNDSSTEASERILCQRLHGSSGCGRRSDPPYQPYPEGDAGRGKAGEDFVHHHHRRNGECQ